MNGGPIKPGRRLRSRHVIMGGIAATVITICSCGLFAQREERHCVDSITNSIIDDDDCDDNRSGSRWYYGGTSAKGKMVGGSFERGGFGGFRFGGSGS